jgi:CheY-like chemotaxis protein/anti-sigma regulatory factor (Ser/Thr protein kinase)
LPVLHNAHLPEDAAMAVEVIERQVTHMTRLVDDLLDISRIRAGKIELRPEYVTLRTVIKHAVEEAAPAIAKASHSLEIDIPDEPVWVHGDPARLAQVVTNLLDNSAKYTPRGGRLRLVVSSTGEQAAISVRDNGIGIPGDRVASVFEMFQQVKTSPEASRGLGIGLAVVKRIVEMHGGSVEAQSDGPGRGSQFTVRLAVARAGEGGEAERGQFPVAMKRLRVLVVDDNPDLVAMLALFIESFGHDVQKAFDGWSAISTAASYRPHVVVLDLELPGMSGLEVARELRRRPETSSAHLVALTGNSQETDRHATQEAGFEAHLTKPTDPDMLEGLLRAVSERVSQEPSVSGAESVGE